MMEAVVLAAGQCAYVVSDGPQTSAALQKAGLTLHWFRGSDRCAPRCPGCSYSTPDGVWVTRSPGFLMRRSDVRFVGVKAPATFATDESRATDADIDIPLPEGMSLRPYQKAAVAYAVKRKNVLIAEEMGLGKTCEAIATVNYLRTPKRILVVCPATLKLNWQREIEAWDYEAGAVIICERADDLPWTELLKPPPGAERIWCICNPERIIAAKAKNETWKRERAGGMWEALMRCQWDVLILDEAHRYKNPKALSTPRILGARRTRQAPAYDGLVQRSRRTIALTGTPIPNKVRELWPLVSVLAPDAFPKQWDFWMRFCGAKQEQIYVKGCKGVPKEVWDFDGASHLDELQTLLRSSCMVRRLKKDVLTELPVKIRQIIPLPAAALQQQIDSERQGWLRLAPSIDKVRADALFAEALGDAFAYEAALDKLDSQLSGLDMSAISKERQALALAKVPLIVQHIADLLEAPSQKVVVMAHHHVVIERLLDALAPYGAVAVYGETPMDKRQSIVDAFQSDPGLRVFVAGLHAAGVGITLTAASVMIFAETDWEAWVLAQAEDRIHRIGQTKSVLIQYPVADGSVEALVVASALAKQRVADQALDGAPRNGGRRRDWPKATDAQRSICAEYLRAWAIALRGEHGLSERTAVLVSSLVDRASKRPLSDGEIWLCRKIARENARTLPQRLRVPLMQSPVNSFG